VGRLNNGNRNDSSGCYCVNQHCTVSRVPLSWFRFLAYHGHRNKSQSEHKREQGCPPQPVFPACDHKFHRSKCYQPHRDDWGQFTRESVVISGPSQHYASNEKNSASESANGNTQH